MGDGGSQGPLDGGFQTGGGGVPDLNSCVPICHFCSFLGLSRFFGDIPDLSFSFVLAYESTYKEHSERSTDQCCIRIPFLTANLLPVPSSFHFRAQYDWTTGVLDNGNGWRKFRAVPRLYPLRSLVCTLFNKGGSRGAFRLLGAGGDHFHCTVEPSPGHIRCRSL